MFENKTQRNKGCAIKLAYETRQQFIASTFMHIQLFFIKILVLFLEKKEGRKKNEDAGWTIDTG